MSEVAVAIAGIGVGTLVTVLYGVGIEVGRVESSEAKGGLQPLSNRRKTILKHTIKAFLFLVIM
jgi:hypothetical protein